MGWGERTKQVGVGFSFSAAGSVEGSKQESSLPRLQFSGIAGR